MGIRYFKKTNFSNRGMGLESDINISNEYYLNNDIAVVYKKPTPIQVTKVEYPSRDKTIIKEGFYKSPSTTDYNGIYKGRYIDFEAKETNSKTSFPLSNIHVHQLEHIQKIINHGGIAFIIIRFNLLNETYFVKGEDILKYIKNTTRKSIEYNYIRDNGYIIKDKFIPRVDYIKIVDKIIEEESNNE